MVSLRAAYAMRLVIALGFSYGTLALLPRSADAQTAASSAAPTAAQDPKQIDQAWQHATAKYDEPRAAILKEVDRASHEGPFRPDWESLQKYEVPEWYKDAKFGIFIHWGVYSVPAFGNEWYPRNMYRPESDEYKHHVATYGPVDKFGYKDFVPMFKAEHFDPAAWARLFKEAGAQYVVPVAEHHDGFAMYDSGLSDWTAAKMGPHRDVVGDLAKAVRAEGLHFGASTHRVEHNFFLGVGRRIASDVNDPQYAAFYGPAQTWLMNPGGTPHKRDRRSDRGGMAGQRSALALFRNTVLDKCSRNVSQCTWKSATSRSGQAGCRDLRCTWSGLPVF